MSLTGIGVERTLVPVFWLRGQLLVPTHFIFIFFSMMRSSARITLALFVISVFSMMLSSCAMEHPGEVQTTGVQQFLGDGFSFKHPDNGRLDLRGETDWARRTLTISGPDVRLMTESGEDAITLPAFEYFVEVFNNPDRLNGREFARIKISEAADANGEAGGRNVRVRGMEALETRFVSDSGYYTVRTFVAKGDVALAIGYRDMPAENNPITDAWRGTWRMALDSVRMD